jgi:hypothetical protein
MNLSSCQVKSIKKIVLQCTEREMDPYVLIIFLCFLNKRKNLMPTSWSAIEMNDGIMISVSLVYVHLPMIIKIVLFTYLCSVLVIRSLDLPSLMVD